MAIIVVSNVPLKRGRKPKEGSLDKGLRFVEKTSLIGTCEKNLIESNINVYTIPKVVITEIKAITKKILGMILSEKWFFFFIFSCIISLTVLFSMVISPDFCCYGSLAVDDKSPPTALYILLFQCL
jgi:hypothetical protein